MIDWLEDYWNALLLMLAEMAPYLLLGFFFAGLLRAFVPKSIYKKHLAPRSMGSVVKAAALGVPLPLCSCGVIPTSVELRREGASHGACTSFLIATPQTGVDSIAATYSMMGLPFAIVRPIAALFTALFGGWLVNRYAKDDEQVSEAASHSGEHDHCHCGHDHEHEPCGCGHDHHHSETGHHGFLAKFWDSMHYAFVEMLQDVGKWLVIGLLIAALITVAVPDNWLTILHDYKLLNMLLVLAIAIPMYVCATGSIPIAVSLMAKGLTPGAALVLLMAGPAVNSASMLVIGNVFGKRTFKLYLLSIIIGAVAFGLCIDYLLPTDWFIPSGIAAGTAHCADCINWWEWVFIGIFLALLINAFARQILTKHNYELHELNENKHNNKLNYELNYELHEFNENNTQMMETKDQSQTEVFEVKGMSCNHCKMSVERAVSDVEGVESVEVDLQSGKVYVKGTQQREEVVKAITALGFNCE